MNAMKQQNELESIVSELRNLSTETEWVEFKVNYANPQTIGERISAISNMAALKGKICGYMVWGIHDETHEIAGTAFEPQRAKKGGEDLQLWLSRQLTPRIHFQFHEVGVGGRRVVLLEIPKAAGRPTQFGGVEYVRVGSHQQKLKEYPEFERELWRAFDTTPFEKGLALQHVESGAVLDLLDYPAYFSLMSLPLPDNKKGVLSAFENEGLITVETPGKFAITHLGAILFAKNLAQFGGLGRKAARVVQYKNGDRLTTVRETVRQKGYAADFAAFMEFLKNLLPENEILQKAFRKTTPMYPPVAIRETLANALIHQDFAMQGCGPLCEIFSDRVEITNPGEPLVNTARFLDSPPRSRNEALAAMMRRMGICEERGSGVDKIVFETELYQLPAPIFEQVPNFTRAVLFAHKPFKNMGKEDRCRACYLHACLKHVGRDPMTNASLRVRFGIEEKNSSIISRIIKETMDSELVRPYDAEQGRKYARYLPFWA